MPPDRTTAPTTATTSMFPKITDQGLDDLRRRIGVEITDTLEPWCHEATRDGIRHYAHGIGDDNPLWCDPEYAKGTRWGDVIAPPSFLFATSRIISGYVGGLPGVHAMWAGADWTWHLARAAQRRDHGEGVAQGPGRAPDGVRRAARSSRSITSTSPTSAATSSRPPIAGASARTATWRASTAPSTRRSRPSRPKRYTDEELAEVYGLYAREEVRGAVPRYWGDVREGDRLPAMAKGPMTVTGFIAYAQGWGGLYIRANKLAWKQIHRHSGLGIKNRFGIPDCPERVHWEHEFATMVGAPGAYDYGPERCSWLTHHLTNWMGDDGILRRAHCKIRRHNPEGDTLRIEGTVVGKRVEGGRHLVEIEQEARNQDGELSVVGGGVVELPVAR